MVRDGCIVSRAHRGCVVDVARRVVEVTWCVHGAWQRSAPRAWCLITCMVLDGHVVEVTWCVVDVTRRVVEVIWCVRDGASALRGMVQGQMRQGAMTNRSSCGTRGIVDVRKRQR